MTDQRGSYKRNIGEQNNRRILEAIRQDPLAAAEISDRLGIHPKTTSDRIRMMHRAGDLHVANWEPHNGKPRAMYLAGPGEDKPNPGRIDLCTPRPESVLPDEFMYRMCSLSA